MAEAHNRKRTPIRIAFGKIVREKRLLLGLSQEKLAEKADLHTNYVGSVERGERNIALENIYAVGVQKELPFLGKWMQKESLDGGSRRKVFMVPTPLHIPDSETSPIAQSLHHVLLFKDLASSGKLRLVPASKILWKHPLVYVQKRRG